MKVTRHSGIRRVGTVYVLTDIDNVPRYVGSTAISPESRRRAHVKAGRDCRSTPVAIWVAELLAQGREPILHILRQVDMGVGHVAFDGAVVCSDEAVLHTLERFMVARLTELGHDLLNVCNIQPTLGGTIRTAEVRRREATHG